VTPDQARGALLGLAVGDALGTTLEFSRPDVASFPTLLAGPHTDIVGAGPFHLEAGQVTDDTHMACALAASLKACDGFNAGDVAARYVAWKPHTFDIGHTTSSAIAKLARGELDAGRQVWEAGGRRGAANGSLMRTAPIGVFFAGDPGPRRAASLADSALTHFDPRCRLACAAFNAALDGDDPEEELRLASRELGEPADELLEDLALARRDDPELHPLMHTAPGFVRVAFRLAFWELWHAPSFVAGVIDAVNRGGDADTNGAIVGALLGSRHGAAAIPEAWQRRVLAALQAGPPGPLRDDYHPKVLLRLL
jgi:ADP-ribosylglycohydrolase